MPAAFRRVLRAGATLVGLIDAAVVVPLAVLVPVLYGDEFAEAAPVFVVLALALGISVAAGPVTAFVSARLSAGELLRASVIALVADVALAVALIPVLGVWGAVIANVTGALLSLVILAHWELRVLGISWATALRDMLAIWVASLVAVLLVLIVPLVPGGPWAHAVTAALVGGVVYVLVLRLFGAGLNSADNAAIGRALPGGLRWLAVPLLTFLGGPRTSPRP